MFLDYKVLSKVNPKNRNGGKFYPQLIHMGNISRAMLGAAIVREITLRRSDVRGMLVIFSYLLSDFLSQRFIVCFEEVGLLSLLAMGKGKVNEAEVRANSIEHIYISYRGATELIEKLAKLNLIKPRIMVQYVS